MESDSPTHGQKRLETLTTTSAAHKLGAVSEWQYGCKLGFMWKPGNGAITRTSSAITNKEQYTN